MNVASLELCKELFELSGWLDVERFWVVGAHKEDDNTLIIKTIYSPNMAYWSKQAPAYDLGYLLRKLPQDEANSFPHHFRPHLEQERKGQWSAYLECDTAYEGGEHKGFSMADTPEDAVARLAIDLFKQGVLAPPSKEEPKA